MTHPFVSPLYRPGLNGPKSTAHAYLSFPLLLCPSNEGSRFVRLVALRVTLRESRDLGASTGYRATSQRWWYLPYALVGLT